MWKMRNCAQYFFVARKMRKFAPTRKPVVLENLILRSAGNPQSFQFTRTLKMKENGMLHHTSFIPVSEDSYFIMINGDLINRSVFGTPFNSVFEISKGL